MSLLVTGGLGSGTSHLAEYITGWLELRNETDFEETAAKVVDYLNA